MTSLSLVAVLGLATVHAPQVAPETIVAFAHTESRMNPLALYDNTSKESYAPGTAAAAAALAKTLLDKGHSIDVGLMQINSQNFRLTGLDAVSAFDPAQSIQAAGDDPDRSLPPLRLSGPGYRSAALHGEHLQHWKSSARRSQRLRSAHLRGGGNAGPGHSGGGRASTGADIPNAVPGGTTAWLRSAAAFVGRLGQDCLPALSQETTGILIQIGDPGK